MNTLRIFPITPTDLLPMVELIFRRAIQKRYSDVLVRMLLENRLRFRLQNRRNWGFPEIIQIVTFLVSVDSSYNYLLASITKLSAASLTGVYNDSLNGWYVRGWNRCWTNNLLLRAEIPCELSEKRWHRRRVGKLYAVFWNKTKRILSTLARVTKIHYTTLTVEKIY